MARKTQTRSKQPSGGQPEKPSPQQQAANMRLEWTVAIVSGAIVLALVGFILYEAIVKTNQRPDISFAVTNSFAMSEGFAAEVAVRNDGHVTVSDVELVAEARLEGGGTETSTVTLDYLPAESRSEVGFGFSREIDPERLAFRVLGYTYP